uniref:Uncharacterized protein n=1 Tax=Daphnia galeata TaxID=27404 RepID=A0A8J2WH18_9CRUS|nr:unnamed protein product [Daphnia galeata]
MERFPLERQNFRTVGVAANQNFSGPEITRTEFTPVSVRNRRRLCRQFIKIAGVITDKNVLPVTRLNFGRTQLATSSGVHTLGRFECSGSVALTGLPGSCEDLWLIGHTLNGIYSVMEGELVKRTNGSNEKCQNRYLGKSLRKKLLFVPNADTNPEEKHEISEPALFRFLLNEKTIEAQAEIQAMLNTLSGIDKLSKITEIEIHESSMGSVTDFGQAFHAFIVFKTISGMDGEIGDYWWWSLEKNREYIVLQRSRNKNDVKDKLYSEKRKEVKSIEENLVGKGTIKDLLSILWAYQAISERYNLVNSNCQSLVKLVSNKITENGYEFKEFFEFIPLLKRYVNKFLPHEENPKSIF